MSEVKTQADFQKDAVTLLESQPAEEATETPAEPESADQETPEADEAQETEPEEAQPEQKDEPEVKPDKKALSYAELAKQKAEIRARERAVRESEQRSAKAAALAAAAESGDAMALLSAAGIPWRKAADQVLGGKDEEKPAAKPETAEYSELKKEVEALKAERNYNKQQEKRRELLGNMTKIVKADSVKFAFVEEFEAQDEALQFVERYYAENGELPGEDLDESIQIGLEITEKKYADEAEARVNKLQKALTKKKSGVKNTGKQEVLSASSKSATKTLTNSTGSGPASRSEKPKARSTEEYQRAALLAMPDAED